jgi:hypothetical protein
MVLPVACRDTPPSFLSGAFNTVEKHLATRRIYEFADLISLGAAPKTVVQYNINTKVQATHPHRAEEIEDGSLLLLENGDVRIFTEQARHPLVGRKADRAMAPLQFFGESRLPGAEEAEQKVCCRHAPN